MWVQLTPSQYMALTSILGDEVLRAARQETTEVHLDVARNVETTPADLLRVFMDAWDARRPGPTEEG